MDSQLRFLVNDRRGGDWLSKVVNRITKSYAKLTILIYWLPYFYIAVLVSRLMSPLFDTDNIVPPVVVVSDSIIAGPKISLVFLWTNLALVSSRNK